MQMVEGTGKKEASRHHNIGSFSKVGLRRSKARYLTVCPKRHQPGDLEALSHSMIGTIGVSFPFFLTNRSKSGGV